MRITCLVLSTLLAVDRHNNNVVSSFQIRPTITTKITVLKSKQQQQQQKQQRNQLSLSFMRQIEDNTKKLITGTVLTSLLWTAPVTLSQQTNNIPFVGNNNNNAIVHAKEMASGSGSRVNKDPESLLRLGLPIDSKEARQLQSSIEGIKGDISSKRKSAALDGVKSTRQIIKSKSSKLTSACRTPSTCTTILTQMDTLLDPLDTSLKASTNVLQGSEQERDALDAAYKSQTQLAKLLTDLQEQMIPPGYKTPVPEEYSDLPQLTGRATVEFVLRKPDGMPFDVEGTNYPEAKMTMIIDGYAAPVTGGNFIDLVKRGFYDNMEIQRSDGFVVQTGKPKGNAEGFVGGTPSKSIGAGKNGERLIPSEIFVKGDKGPFYETTIEDEGRGGQATVLPFSSYGAMGWAREEYDPNSGSSQFFWLLFDSDLTPAGKNVLDGRYPCFGYVVEGADFLRDAKEGDIIVSTKITNGIENLVTPKGGISSAVENLVSSS